MKEQIHVQSSATALLGVLLLASFATFAAQDETAILGYVGSASFWINAPPGWTSDPEEADRRDAIFILTPAGRVSDGAETRITGSAYRNVSVDEALARVRRDILSQDPAARIEPVPAPEAAAMDVSIVSVRSRIIGRQFESIAFMPLAGNVVVIRLSATSGDPHQRGHSALLELIATYEEAGAGLR